MNRNRSNSWKDAFLASPGPRTLKEALKLSLRGICMGAADVIPGVSGGTIALITGIYENLIQAIGSIDLTVFKNLLAFDLKGVLARVHIRFLLALFLGIGIAIISLARLMNYLLHNHAVLTWSLFFGLIAASILVVGRQVKQWLGFAGISFIAGVIVATVIVNLIPVNTPEDLWFIFLCGFVAICAMILPGISGAFILLILGKYEFITATLKNPFLLSNFIVILIFCAGCIIGLLGFSKILDFMLRRYHNLTLAFLTGLMTGSMQKIWPWKDILEIRVIRGKEHVIWGQNILPEAWNTELWGAIMLAVAGFMAVMLLEWLSRERQPD